MDASVQKITLVIRNLRRKNEGKMKERMGPLARSDSVWGIADRGCLALRAWAPPATVIGPLRGHWSLDILGSVACPSGARQGRFQRLNRRDGGASLCEIH